MGEEIARLASHYLARSYGPLARLPPGDRLALLLLVSTLSIAVGSTRLLALLLAFSVALFASVKPSRRKTVAVTGFVALTVWSIAVAQALFYQATPRTVIMVLVPPETPVIGQLTGGVYVYQEGVWYGLKQSMRAASCMLTAAAVASTMSALDAAAMLSRHRRLLALLLSGVKGAEKLFHELEDSLAATRFTGARRGLHSLYTLACSLTARIREAATTMALVIEYASPHTGRRVWSILGLVLAAASIAVLAAYTLYKLVQLGLLWTPQLRLAYEQLRLVFD